MNPLIPADALVVAIGPGGRTGKWIQIRTQPDSVRALRDALRADDIATTFSVQNSVEVTGLAALVASIGTGLPGVAAVLSAYLRRHQDRVILLQRDGTRYELRGMPPEEMEDRLRQMLEKAAEDQRNTEHLYRGIPGADDEAN